jgi:hypothetical protein
MDTVAVKDGTARISLPPEAVFTLVTTMKKAE